MNICYYEYIKTKILALFPSKTNANLIKVVCDGAGKELCQY